MDTESGSKSVLLNNTKLRETAKTCWSIWKAA